MKYILLVIVLGLPLTVFGNSASQDAETCDCSNTNMDCSGREISPARPVDPQPTATNAGASQLESDSP